MEEFWRTCMNMMMGSGGVLMMIVMILFWVAVIALIVLGIRWLWRQERAPNPRSGEDPLEILGRRYAAGEIDDDEFGKGKRSLSESSARPH